MKIIVVASKLNLDEYADFVSTLNALGVEAIIAHKLKSCFLSELAPLYVVPFPRLIELIKRFDPDLVITDSPFYAPEMVKLTGRKIFYHMLGDAWSEYCFNEIHYPSIFTRMYTHYLSKILNKGIRDTDLVLANSKWLLDIVKEKMPTHPANLLYTGIDVNKWLPHQKAPFYLKHPAILGILTLSTYGKVVGLLKFIQVVRDLADVNFYFAGGGDYYPILKQNCPRNMSLLGKVPKEDIPRLLDAADIFVHPSGQDVLPRCLKEASLMEKPIIASNVGGNPEIIINAQTGYLCPLNDIEQWKRRIQFLLDHHDLAKELGKNARRFVTDTFDWRKIVGDFLIDMEKMLD